MTLTEILVEARAKLNDQYVPYKWSDIELFGYANEAEREACRRANLIVDNSISDYCSITLVAGKSLYTLDGKVLRIRNSYIGPSMTSTKLSWNSTTRTLADSSSGFLTAGFKEGTAITISGFTLLNNNGAFTINSVVAGSIVVAENTMNTEIAGDSVTVHAKQTPMVETTREVMDTDVGDWQNSTGEPFAFIKEAGTEFLAYPIPIEANTVSLVVTRLPDIDMISLSSEPEIPEQYHYDLVLWMCKLAYEKADSDTLDLKKAIYYDEQFSNRFGDRPSARAEAFRRRNPKNGQMRWKEFGI